MSRSERRPLLIRSLLPDWVSELGYPTSATQMQRRLDAILDDDDYHTLIATGAFSVSSELASVRSMKTTDNTARLWRWSSRQRISVVASVER